MCSHDSHASSLLCRIFVPARRGCESCGAVRGSITARAVTWAIGQFRREHATIAGLARQLGTSWKTVWRAIEPELVRLAADESRFENVTMLGVDEHV